jgi:hypothetical protein
MRRGDVVNPIMLHTACGAKSHKPYGSFARFEFPLNVSINRKGVPPARPIVDVPMLNQIDVNVIFEQPSLDARLA